MGSDDTSNNKRKADDISKDGEDDPTKKDDAAVAAAVAEAVDEAVNGSKDGDDEDGVADTPGGHKRRFFPRVKHLLTREWEPVRVYIHPIIGGCHC